MKITWLTFPSIFAQKLREKKIFQGTQKLYMTYLELFPIQIVVPKSTELKLVLNVS